ncbi:MAG: ethylbenzene dehydrogenase-related protein [Azoarcus sp.]|nr:ethylbenzene dehydrogenase-related protein [Azoarcus sp.]
MNKTIMSAVAGALLVLGAGGATAAAPADWSKIAAKDITLFHPGVSPLEWITKGTEHGGARALKKGETCADCHSDEAAAMGQKMASGQKIEPSPIAGKAPSIPVKVQAAHDGDTLYLRFTWKQPKSSGAAKMDDKNPVKIAFMLESGGKVELADQSGCWASCHTDSRTMPGAADTKTKYVKGGSLAEGRFYDLVQWRSGEKKGFDGHVADTRVMEGGKALVSADGKLDGDSWSVVFARKFAGGDGDVKLEAGKAYNFGFAIHDDNAAGRFHQVSLGYKLGIDAAADITAAKQ